MSEKSVVREIGVPVHAVNRAHLYAGRDREGAPCLYATMSQQADNFFVLQIDPKTGATRQFSVDVPESNYTTAVYMGRDGRLYIGAAHSGHLFCFDPAADGLLDLGQINGDAAIFPCRIDEDGKGRLWIGSYGTADLSSYDLRTGEFVRYGRMDETDMYNYPLVNADGTVACFIAQTLLHVVVFDPQTERRQTVGPVVAKGEGTLEMWRGEDRSIYIESSEGDFRIEGMEAVAVEDLPAPAVEVARLPDGRCFRFADAAEDIHRVLEIAHPNGTVETFDLAYEASGTNIFYLHAGPEGCLYGSSVLPEHLFRYDPADGEMCDLGVCSVSRGEAYSMANLDGRIYISSYPAARISVYDPGQPYRFGEDAAANPRDVGRMDEWSKIPLEKFVVRNISQGLALDVHPVADRGSRMQGIFPIDLYIADLHRLITENLKFEFGLHIVHLDRKIGTIQLAAKNGLDVLIGMGRRIDVNFKTGYKGGQKEGKSLNVIPVRMGYKEVNLARRIGHHRKPQLTDS